MKSSTTCEAHAPCQERAGQPGIDRRTLLRVGAAGSAMVVSLPFACGPAGGSPPTGPLSAGNVSGVPVDSLLVVDTAILGRDANGLYAMSAVCTHQGGPLGHAGASAAAGLVCPWHGSRFDQNGAVTNGPAASPLQHYQVDLATTGEITIQGGIPVASTARTAVP